jgi:predicted small secreted protein
MFKNIVAILLLAGFIAGCNTMKGVGQDIERGGEKMQDSAEKNKN